MNGIYTNENLNPDEPVKDKVHENAWSFNPLVLKGVTGSPGNSVVASSADGLFAEVRPFPS